MEMKRKGHSTVRNVSENPTHLEGELGVAIIADRASYFHRAEDRVHDERPSPISEEVGRFRAEREGATGQNSRPILKKNL